MEKIKFNDGTSIKLHQIIASNDKDTPITISTVRGSYSDCHVIVLY